MNTKIFRCLGVLAALLTLPATLPAQTSPKIDFPSPSPGCTIKQHIGLTDVEVVYSRPSIKGREIFGGLVPYGKVWRTGANGATKISFSTDVKLNGQAVPAGSYALFTIPGESEWTVILSTNANQFGAFQYDEKADLARFTVSSVELSEQIETFTIEFNQIRDDSAVMNLIWDHTVVPIAIQMDLSSKLVPQIEAVMASDAKQKPYYQAAMFYYDHGLDIEKAKKWVDAAISEHEAYYVVHLKAQILAKMGDKDGAIAAAKHSTELANKANETGYAKVNDELISNLK